MKEQIQDAVARVQQMERCFDELEQAVQNDPAASGEPWFQTRLRQLLDYYENGQWRRDYELDEQGFFPPDLKRGVLAEDTVYHFLTDLVCNQTDGKITD